MKVTIKHCRVTLQTESEYLVDSNGNYRCEFEFDEEWQGHTKIARFARETFYRDVLIEDDGSCRIPPEVLNAPGVLKIGAFSTDGLSSGWYEETVHESILHASKDIEEPVPPISMQVLKRIADYANVCNDILIDCRKLLEEARKI